MAERFEKLSQRSFNAVSVPQREEMFENLLELDGLGGCGLFRQGPLREHTLKVENVSGQRWERDPRDNRLALPAPLGELVPQQPELLLLAAIPASR